MCLFRLLFFQASVVNANSVAPLTPTNSKISAPPSTLLPAHLFVQPVANESDPANHPDILAPWPLIRTVAKGDMSAAVTTRALPQGAKIAKFYGEVHSAPTLYTLQIADNVHTLCVGGGPTYVNHSCDPNCFWDMSGCTAEAPFPIITALRPIAEGEEITFNYDHTEWHMDAPFQCLCGASEGKCLGKIEGFKHLDAETKQRFAPYVSPFIAQKQREFESQPSASGSSSA